ncbi:MAG TPA: hypothetical protein VFQ17_03155, partial [Nocardioides sp.]|nr:hypothetical protein [Nocardioides sp.]
TASSSSRRSPSLRTFRRPTLSSWRDPDTREYGLLLVLVAVAVAFFTYLAHDLWFVWGDDYDFFLMRGTVPVADRGIWAPHDDHWMTAIVLIDRALLSLYGLDSYLPYVLVSIGLHAASVLVVHAVLKRLGAGRWARFSACVVLLFAGAGAQAVLWNTTAGLIGSMFFGWLALLLSLAPPRNERGLPGEPDDDGAEGAQPPWRVWFPLVVGLTFSGTGVVAVLFVGAFTWFQRGLKAALLVVSVPAAVFLVWYIAIGNTGAKAPLEDPWAYLAVPRLVWIGLVHAPDAATGIDGSGPLVLGGLVLATLMASSRVPAGLRALAYAGLIAAVGQLALAALSRPSFGAEAFAGGRYAYLTLFFLAPALVVTLMMLGSWVTAPRQVAVLLALLVGAAYVVNAGALFRAEHDGRLYVSEPWPGLMRGLRDAAQAGEQVLTVDAVDEVHMRFRADLAAREEMWDELPSGAATTEELVYAESSFFTGVSRESFDVGSGEDVRPVLDFDTTKPIRRGCRTLTAEGESPVLAMDTGPDGAQFGVQGPTDRIVAHIVRDKIQGPDRSWAVDPEVGHWVATSAQNAELVVNLTMPGTYTVCKL